MLFPAKTKGFYFEQNEFGVTFARTSAPGGAMVVEDIRECGVGDAQALAAICADYRPKKGASAYLMATCGVSPETRVVRRATLDPKKVREEGYLNELVNSQFRIDAANYTMALLNAGNGQEYDMGRASQKDVIFCGLPAADIIAIQEGLLADGLYPDRLEIGSIAALGAVIDYTGFHQLSSPTLVLEIGTESTHSYIVSPDGIEASRPIQQGLNAMVPVVQKELGLKDEESARKLFLSNTFDFTGMAPVLVKKLLKELQSSIGFYEVQTGQSIGQLVCTVLPQKLVWLEAAIAAQLGVGVLKPDFAPWLQARQITLADTAPTGVLTSRSFALLGLMTQFTASHAVAS
ncbi:MAG: hypothetical protein ABII82_18050 [Verrucomicrobiota bacterium]